MKAERKGPSDDTKRETISLCAANMADRSDGSGKLMIYCEPEVLLTCLS